MKTANYFNKFGNVGSVWIMGLSSSGKTTLAQLLEKKLWENGYPSLLVDGDQIRHIFQERLGYDTESRKKQTRRVLRIVQWISSNGIIPVTAMIHPFEDDRIMCRKVLNNYFEVFLKCNLDVCIKRDTKGVYKPTLEGKAKNVVGLDIPYEKPQHPEIVLESDKFSPEQLLEKLWDNFNKNILLKLKDQKGSDKSYTALKKDIPILGLDQLGKDVCVE